jgi:hypothetical protein
MGGCVKGGKCHRPDRYDPGARARCLRVSGYGRKWCVAYRDYLDEYWVTGFIGVLEWTAALFIDDLAVQFERPPTSANVRHFFYTRRDEIGEAESTGTTFTDRPNQTR